MEQPADHDVISRHEAQGVAVRNMDIKLRTVGMLWLMAIGVMTINAQTFMSAKLERAAEMLGISRQLADTSADQAVTMPGKNGQLLCVRTNKEGVVEHIGIPLFKPEMRVLMPSPVYDFLEFATLNKIYKLNPNQLYLNKVMFKTGNWATLAKSGLPDMECAISNQDDKLYIVTWQRDGQTVAEVGIPIEYELLGNDTRRHMERDFIQHLENHGHLETMNREKCKPTQELSQRKI